MKLQNLARGFGDEAIVRVALHNLLHLAARVAALVVAARVWAPLHLLLTIPAQPETPFCSV